MNQQVKYLIRLIVICLCSNCLYAQKNGTQKTEIILVGTFHSIPDSFASNWEKPYKLLLNCKADAIAGEWVMPDDPLSLAKAYDSNYRQWFDSIMLNWEGKLVNPSDSIAHYNKLINQKASPIYRYKLWRYYYLNIDMGNAEYQLFHLIKGDQNWLLNFDSSSYAAKAFLKNMRRAVVRHKNSEHHNLVFPLAKQLGINYIYPTDDKSTYSYQSNAYGRIVNALSGTEPFKEFESFWQQYIQKEATFLRNSNAFEQINSLQWVDSTDIGQVRILSATNNTHTRDFANIWYFRNKNIARRVAEAATKSKARRMIVVYGNMHVYPVKKYLEEMGYTVKLLGDL